MQEYKTNIGTDIKQAAQYLENDELVIVPTGTGYGLAANVFSERAVEKISILRRKPFKNPLVVYAGRIAEVKRLVQELPHTAEALLERFSPGPLTLLLKKNAIIPPVITANIIDVAIQIPAHFFTLELLHKIDFPLVALETKLTSIRSLLYSSDVKKHFYGKIPYVLDDGISDTDIKSTVVGFERDGTPVIYRQGAIKPDEIESVCGRIKIKIQSETFVLQEYSFHPYRPKTPLYLTDRFHALRNYDIKRTGVLCFNRYYNDVPLSHQFVLSIKGNLEEAAKNLDRGLQYLDDLKLDVIVAEICPNAGLGNIINYRLQRAAYPFKRETVI